MAGGSGSRLRPATFAVGKSLLPVYDKPLIYYPLSLMFTAGARDILIITTARELPGIQALLGDGAGLGVRFSYFVQPEPGGIAQIFRSSEVESFIGGRSALLALGDNIFDGDALEDGLQAALRRNAGATVFCLQSSNPGASGVVELGADGSILSLEEKPAHPRSNWIVPGCYVYDSRVCAIAKTLRPSARGEYEVTNLNAAYLSMGALRAIPFDSGMRWFDAGTAQTLLTASNYVRSIQVWHRRYIACLEEHAYRLGYIGRDELLALAAPLFATEYGRHLRRVAEQARVS